MPTAADCPAFGASPAALSAIRTLQPCGVGPAACTTGMQDRAHLWSPALHGFLWDFAWIHILSLLKGQFSSYCFLLGDRYERASTKTRSRQHNCPGCQLLGLGSLWLQSDRPGCMAKHLVSPSSGCSSEQRRQLRLGPARNPFATDP